MRNGKKKQNDAPLVAFYNMRDVTFVLPDEMADVSIIAQQCFILIPRLNHKGSHRLNDSQSKHYLQNKRTMMVLYRSPEY